MRVLMPMLLAVLFASPFISCRARSPLTPEIAYSMLRDAYMQGDGAAFWDLLDLSSRRQIEELTRLIRTMDDAQAGALAEKLAISPNELKTITPASFISLQIALDKRPGHDILGGMFTGQVLRKRESREKCVLHVAGGLELTFVREGPYWKFEMNGL